MGLLESDGRKRNWTAASDTCDGFLRGTYLYLMFYHCTYTERLIKNGQNFIMDSWDALELAKSIRRMYLR